MGMNFGGDAFWWTHFGGHIFWEGYRQTYGRFVSGISEEEGISHCWKVSFAARSLNHSLNGAALHRIYYYLRNYSLTSEPINSDLRHGDRLP